MVLRKNPIGKNKEVNWITTSVKSNRFWSFGSFGMFILFTAINKPAMHIFTLTVLHICPIISPRVSPKSENTRAHLFDSCYTLSKGPPIPSVWKCNIPCTHNPNSIMSFCTRGSGVEGLESSMRWVGLGFKHRVEATQFEDRGSQRDGAEAEPGCPYLLPFAACTTFLSPGSDVYM